MGIYAMGASSSANKETRELQLKAYLDATATKDYNSLIALEKSGASSWTTFLMTIARKSPDFNPGMDRALFICVSS